jgi:hypothetical protein
MLATSEPAPGSVMASAEMLSPARMGGSTRRFIASEPKRAIGGAPMVWLLSEAEMPPAPARASSCAQIRR